MYKESIVIKIIRIVVFAGVAFLIFAMISKSSKKTPQWADQLITKYDLDAEKQESYYEGFRDAIDYVYDHLDELGLYRW